MVTTPQQSCRAGDIRFRYNPRQVMSAQALDELAESIRAQGVLQPILVRPTAEGPELVAGHRRLTAFIKVNGENSHIPVLMRELSDQEADAAAAAENIDREQMTAVDEAEAAAKVLANAGADRTEAARRLGWKPELLNRRLALMNATQGVREALRSHKITLGHSELLAALRREVQDQLLAKITAPEAKLPKVDEFKAMIDQAALLLKTAIFNKTECATCHHNSDTQSALFSETISAGRCTNKTCYDAKTEAELNIRADQLREDYQVVRIVRPGDNLTVIPLVADGPKGVGQEQAKACKLCKDYGAAVSASPDKLGNTYTNLCMNVACNSQMVKAANPPPAAAPKGDAPSKTPAAASAGKSKEAETKAKAGPVYPEPKGQVKEYREKLWRAVYALAMAKLSVVQNRKLLLAIVLSSNGRNLSSDGLAKKIEVVCGTSEQGSKLHSTRFGKSLQALEQLDDKQLSEVLGHVAAQLSNDADIESIVDALKFFDVKISDYWKLTKDFLNVLTKSEIEAVADELKLKQAIGSGAGKLFNGSKGDLIEKLLKVEGFEYRGAIPKILQWSK